MPPRLTQSQRDVLALYRRGLRLIRTKPEESQPHFTLYLRHFFRHPSMGGGLKRRDFAAIEYMTRRAHRMLEEVFQPTGVKNVQLPLEAQQDMVRLGLDHYWRGK